MKKFFTIALLLVLTQGTYTQEINLEMLSSLSAEEIELAKEQLNISQKSERPAPEINESTLKIVLEEEQEDDNQDKDKLNKYGYDFFSTIPTSVSAVGDLPLPNDYKISLKDQFTIILSGSKEEIFDVDVNLDGTILFPELGSISVVGESFRDVKSKLRNIIDQSYIGVQIDISIKNLAAKKITIVGAVNTPGTYLVNPFSTISSALAYSGGVSEIGTLRKIKLIRNDGNIYYFDLYKLLIKGDRSDDITIESGDVIVIDPATQFIELSGEVKRPAIYEVIKDETISDLISFGLGFTNIANKTNIQAEILDNKKSFIRKMVISDISEDLSSILSVNINPYVSKNISSIEVYGAVKEPGIYDLNQYKTLEELISDLEFVEVYPWLGVIEQFDEENLISSSTLFSLKDKSSYKSISLLPNSKVYFSNRDSRLFSELSPQSAKLIEDYQLVLNHKGEEYKLPVFGRFMVKSFIDFLGLDMTDIDQVATYVSPLENLVLNQDYKKMSFSAAKFNTISFKSPINDLISVTVSGAVNYPGTYTLQSGATISELYSMIGDFKQEAFIDGVIFLRESVREQQLESLNRSKEDLNRSLFINSQGDGLSIDPSVLTALNTSIEPKYLGRIAGDFSPGSQSSFDTILLDGDSIFIPKIPNVVSVLGEVLNPIAFEYDGKISIKEAINNAGGFREYADSKKVYLIKANGMVKANPRNIFSGSVRIEPGDTIVVPRKINISNPLIESIVPAAEILSSLAFSAAAIESLSNNNNN